MRKDNFEGDYQQPKREPIPFIRELCKHKTEEEIEEAEDNFREYLRIVQRIHERLKREQEDESSR